MQQEKDVEQFRRALCSSREVIQTRMCTYPHSFVCVYVCMRERESCTLMVCDVHCADVCVCKLQSCMHGFRVTGVSLRGIHSCVHAVHACAYGHTRGRRRCMPKGLAHTAVAKWEDRINKRHMTYSTRSRLAFRVSISQSDKCT